MCIYLPSTLKEFDIFGKVKVDIIYVFRTNVGIDSYFKDLEFLFLLSTVMFEIYIRL